MAREGRRVVVTGAAAISPLGQDWAGIHARLRTLRNAVRNMPEWDAYAGLNTRLAAPALPFELPPHYNRKTTRSMGRVALMAVRASELALQQAGLLDHPVLRDGRTGVSYGCSAGSHEAGGGARGPPPRPPRWQPPVCHQRPQRRTGGHAASLRCRA